jgi:hypothetical protein
VNQTLRIIGKVSERRAERIVLSVYAASGLLLWAGVIAGTIHLLLALSSLVLATPSYGQARATAVGPEIRLEAETATQDLAGASLSVRHSKETPSRAAWAPAQVLFPQAAGFETE